MAFCIECGAKAPDIAKFCPQCGVALVQIESPAKPASKPVVVTPKAETPEVAQTEAVKAEISETGPEDVKSDPSTPIAEPTVVDITPSPVSSLAAAASVGEDAPKSKTGLFIGLGVAALIAAGGGAYAMGLFDGSDKDSKIIATAPSGTAQAGTASPTLTERQNAETGSSNADPILSAYQDAIKSGRISDLGQFANDNPDSGLAKDAETAAFDSLQRQGSVLAYTTFMEYFPEADMATYLGPRINIDEGAISDEPVVVELAEPLINAPSIRFTISQRAEELEPFIEQGDTGYAVSVIDEMLGLTDLNDVEITYLLNLRALAETSPAFATPAEAEVVQPDPIAPEPINSDTAETAPIEPAPFEPAPFEPEAVGADLIETATEPFLQTVCSDGSIIPPGVNCPAPPKSETTTILPEAETEVEVEAENAVKITKSELPYDTAAKPLERFGAETPESATEPGACDMFFDVSLSGTPTNIDASCSDPILIAPAKDAVSGWVYEPALLNGVPVRQNDIQVKIRFNLE